MIPEAIRQLHLCTAFKGYAVPLMGCISCSDDIVVASKFPRNLAMEQNYIVAFAQKWKLELSFENNQSFS